MLIGSYSGVLSEKRRVAVPRKFLEETGTKLILAKWYENCLILVNTIFWDKLFDRLTGGQRVVTYGIRDNERFILGTAFETEPDEQGRIVIPELLANYAELGKEIVFIGLRDRIEIWSKEMWDKKSEELAQSAREYLENLDKKT